MNACRGVAKSLSSASLTGLAGLAGLLALALSGCGGDSAPGDIEQSTENNEAHDPPKVPKLQPGWNEIRPGGESICARGTDFSFFVSPGSKNRVVIDFIGGGACWTKGTCSLAGSLFSDSVDELRERAQGGLFGIYDRTLPENPFRNWFHVVIPYCTGDIHWGDSVVTYGEGEEAVTIHHKGAANARAVLAWIFENFSAPETVLVTGCSAGAYGSIFWTPHIKQHYPEAKVRQLGDSGAGIITDSFFRESFPQWNATGAAPAWIPSLDPSLEDFTKLSLPDLYDRLGDFYPDLMLSQFNTEQDSTQKFFFKAMGGASEEWSSRMFAATRRTDELMSNYYAFVAPGNQHCVLPYDEFYTMESDGVLFSEWLGQLIAGEPLESVYCEECQMSGTGN